jgi:hypothetical protein
MGTKSRNPAAIGMPFGEIGRRQVYYSRALGGVDIRNGVSALP